MNDMACHYAAATRAPQPPAPLVQIRQGYRAEWQDFSLAVESGAGQWTVRVEESGRNLYEGLRSNAGAARIAALEFALFRAPNAAYRKTAERLAEELAWRQYW
jgi:hypothetical protein